MNVIRQSLLLRAREGDEGILLCMSSNSFPGACRMANSRNTCSPLISPSSTKQLGMERAGNNFPEFSQSRPSCGKVS